MGINHVGVCVGVGVSVSPFHDKGMSILICVMDISVLLSRSLKSWLVGLL